MGVMIYFSSYFLDNSRVVISCSQTIFEMQYFALQSRCVFMMKALRDTPVLLINEHSCTQTRNNNFLLGREMFLYFHVFERTHLFKIFSLLYTHLIERNLKARRPLFQYKNRVTVSKKIRC